MAHGRRIDRPPLPPHLLPGPDGTPYYLMQDLDGIDLPDDARQLGRLLLDDALLGHYYIIDHDGESIYVPPRGDVHPGDIRPEDCGGLSRLPGFVELVAKSLHPDMIYALFATEYCRKYSRADALLYLVAFMVLMYEVEKAGEHTIVPITKEEVYGAIPSPGDRLGKWWLPQRRSHAMLQMLVRLLVIDLYGASPRKYLFDGDLGDWLRSPIAAIFLGDDEEKDERLQWLRGFMRRVVGEAHPELLRPEEEDEEEPEVAPLSRVEHFLLRVRTLFGRGAAGGGAAAGGGGEARRLLP